MDASTLGKIDVVGPDAATFLDRMYTNRMSTLRAGSIRYGLMCGVDGMAFDDGVVMRLADDRFFVTTTTGGAAKVLEHFEEWLQTEWPDLRVYCTSVTEQWSTIAMNGPRARDVLDALGTDVDLSADAFPFMTFREGTVAGMPTRIARVSFSGELAYELNVAGWHGHAMWEAVMAAGEPFDITPYGTEAMHVLRAEKGFPIIGQDTDGTVTPHDLGMSWIVRNDDSDFLGKRSFRRPDTMRSDRKQLVGLLSTDPQVLIPEGAQLVAEDTGRIPMPMVGHVTSSYRSAILDRTFALAMVEGGHAMHGRTIYAPLPEGTIAAVVTHPSSTTRRERAVTADERARSPLAHRLDDLTAIGVRTGGGVIVEHVPFLAQVDVRVDAALGGRAPYPLPTTPNTAWEEGPRAALWLGPDEWLVLGPPGAGADIVGELERSARRFAPVDRRRLREPRRARAVRPAREGGPVEGLRDRPAPVASWRPGMCAQTMLARAQVILHERSDSTGILVRPSFADYLVDWLIDASGA